MSGAFNVIVVGRLLSDDFEWYCYNILLHEFKPTLQLMNSRVDVFMGATAGYPSEGVPTTASSSLDGVQVLVVILDHGLVYKHVGAGRI